MFEPEPEISTATRVLGLRVSVMERLGRRIGALNTDEVDRIIEGLFELAG